MGHIRDLYGDQGQQFICGFIAAMQIYLDELLFREDLHEEIKNAISELGDDPELYKDEIL